MSTQETFGDRLLALLKQHKLSQQKVAEALGVSRTAVNKWTKGGMIDDMNLENLADFLQVDKIWLKYGEYQTNETAEEFPLSTRHINDFYLQESNKIVTWEWDILTDDLRYSDNVEQIYGIPIHTNQDFLSLMSEGAQEKLLVEYAKIIQHGGAHEIDFKISLNGEIRWITSRAAGMKGPNGKITKIVGISLDNTARKKNELFLRQFKGFFELLLQTSPHLIVFIDPAGEILASNCLDKKVDYLNLQSFLYQLAIEEKKQILHICEQAQGTIVFQEKVLKVTKGTDNEGVIFLMLEIDPELLV